MRLTGAKKIIALIICIVIEIILGAAIVWIVTNPFAIEIPLVVEADVCYAGRREAETEAEEAETFVIYREGDGEPPEWYKPDEAMAAEWYADTSYLLDVPLDAEFQAYLYDLCSEYDLPYTLVVAVIEAESTYRADVISDSSDYGLMQINKVCHEWLSETLGITDYLDPRQNVLAGVYILSNYYMEYKYPSGTLIAYNMGQIAAEALFAQGIYDTDYSRRVMDIMRRLVKEGG